MTSWFERSAVAFAVALLGSGCGQSGSSPRPTPSAQREPV